MTLQTKKLGEIILENKKSILKSKGNNDGIYPFFVSGFNIKKIDSYLIDNKSIFLPTGGNFFVHYYDGKSAYSTDTWSVRTTDDVDIRYLYHYLILNQEFIGKKLFKGATIKHLQKNDFRDLKIIVPSFPEQQRIVKILDEVFENIALAKKNAEKNLANSIELSESYLQSVFANPGKNWEEKSLGEFIKLEYGKPLDGKHRDNSALYPVYGANGEKSRSDKFYVDKPSIIVGRKGSAGELNLTEEKFWPLDVTYFVTFDDKKYDLIYIYYLLSTLKLNGLAKGVKPGINRNDVYSITVNVPNSLTEQKSIVAKLDALSAETKKLESIYKQKIADLDELKKSILQKAFAGEL